MSSFVRRILSVMRENRVYTNGELAVMTQLPMVEVSRVTSMLVKGGMVEQKGDKYVKLFKTRQKEFRFYET
jgi:DNA-binding IclR family transcriptional regulator